jgi:4-amino-4-deoxy-L-arabinose transferase-like glycosyltransferase
MALIIKIFGQNENILHVFFIIFPLASALSMYYISKKFTKRPLFAALFLITSVVFVVMSHNLMFDIPFLAFFLLSVAFFVYGVDSNNKLMMILGAVFCGFAYLTKYTGIIVFPVLALYAILRKKPKYILYLAIPAIIGLLWNLYTYLIYGISHNLQIFIWLLSSPNSFSSQAIIVRLITNMTYIGGATIFPLMLLYPFLRERANKLAYFLIVAFSLVAAIVLYYVSANFSYRYSTVQLILFAFFFSAGIFVFYLVIRHNFNMLAELFKQKKIANIFNEKYANNIFLFSTSAI